MRQMVNADLASKQKHCCLWMTYKRATAMLASAGAKGGVKGSVNHRAPIPPTSLNASSPVAIPLN